MGLDSLESRDRADFEKRLSRYGISEPLILRDALEVPPSTTVSLPEMAIADPLLQPIRLPPREINTIKQWVGVPDEAFRNGGTGQVAQYLQNWKESVEYLKNWRPKTRGLSELLHSPTVESLQAFDATNTHIHVDDVHHLFAIARAYVRGDSTHFQEYAALCNHLLPQLNLIVTVWPFQTIRVRRNAVLRVDSTIGVLVAHEIIIEPGGSIQSSGDLKVDCTIIRKM